MIVNERFHKKWEVWKQSITLVTSIYEETKTFPRDEEYGLKSQMRRAALSVPSNIAEELKRKTKNDKLHFLNIALGSLSEIDTKWEIYLNMNYLDEGHYERIEVLLIEIQKLLCSLNMTIRDWFSFNSSLITKLLFTIYYLLLTFHFYIWSNLKIQTNIPIKQMVVNLASIGWKSFRFYGNPESLLESLLVPSQFWR